jgi:hypothetical protein
MLYQGRDLTPIPDGTWYNFFMSWIFGSLHFLNLEPKQTFRAFRVNLGPRESPTGLEEWPN